VVGERGWLQQVRIRIAKVNIKNYTGPDFNIVLKIVVFLSC
jgi:hypothetical protein